MSGYSVSKLKRIKDYWLNQLPKEQPEYQQVKYVIYDATYFHKNGCLINIMNSLDQKIIAHAYVSREGFKNAYPLFLQLKEQGLNPQYITMDGERSVIRAIKKVWPQIKIQRCLYHIQHEGMRWLRSYPKTQAGRELRHILLTVCSIKSVKERNDFIKNYRNWLAKHEAFVLSLPKTDIAFKDLQRTIVLINNALPDMFRYLKNKNVHSTTNALEGFHSRLKSDYQRHRGLTHKHKIQYINWYCYFKNI